MEPERANAGRPSACGNGDVSPAAVRGLNGHEPIRDRRHEVNAHRLCWSNLPRRRVLTLHFFRVYVEDRDGDGPVHQLDQGSALAGAPEQHEHRLPAGARLGQPIKNDKLETAVDVVGKILTRFPRPGPRQGDPDAKVVVGFTVGVDQSSPFGIPEGGRLDVECRLLRLRARCGQREGEGKAQGDAGHEATHYQHVALRRIVDGSGLLPAPRSSSFGASPWARRGRRPSCPAVLRLPCCAPPLPGRRDARPAVATGRRPRRGSRGRGPGG